MGFKGRMNGRFLFHSTHHPEYFGLILLHFFVTTRLGDYVIWFFHTQRFLDPKRVSE